MEEGQPVILKMLSWMCDLAFLSDLCDQLNDLNGKLQGECQLISELCINVLDLLMELSLPSQFWITTLVIFQTGRKYFSNTRQIMVGMSNTLNSSSDYLQTGLWTSIRIEDGSKHLLTSLKHHMKMLNLLYSLNWSTYTTMMNLGLISKKVTA